MTAPRLTHLGAVTGPAKQPGYTPGAHGVGIVHLGIGAFHRAHQAVMTDDALARDGGDWRIVGVSLRSDAIANAMNPQNGLYTLIEQDGAKTTSRVIGAIDRVIAVDPAATLAALYDPAIRVVTLTVTEKGYGVDRATRAPDPRNPAVAADLASPEAPVGVLGLLVAALKQRQITGSPPLAILSCDNLPENGALLRDGVVGFANMLGDKALASWINDNIAFPSSMVDRITPAATPEAHAEALRRTGCDDLAAIETEPFSQWVIEDNFPSGRPSWEAGGALFVKDVAPYERMKLTMLNGTHSMLAYTGFLAGQRYVRDVMADANLATLVKRHLGATADLLPPLQGIEFASYADALAKRFRNVAIAHETAQIAMDGTEKLPQRIFQPAESALQAGKDLRPFAFATAMWMRYCLGRDDDGASYELHDPRRADVRKALCETPETAADISAALHQMPNLIPARLAASPEWRELVEDVLATALTQGCIAAIEQEVAQANTNNVDHTKAEKGLAQEAAV